jgi:HD domain
MTSEQAGATVPAGERRPARDELTIRVFRALYREFDLHTVAGTPVAVPKGTPGSAASAWAASPGRLASTSLGTASPKPSRRGRLKTARRVCERPLHGRYRDRMNQADWAEELARKHLEIPLARRWAHVQGVAAQARSLAPILGDAADLLEAAAWLHDIGYSPELAETGFHPLDGARYLRDVHFADPVLCSLVAHHSCAVIEAEERGLSGELRGEFPSASMVLNDALAYCDMTTDPGGNMVSVHDRLAEIRERYGPSSMVTRFTHDAGPCLIASVERITYVMTGESLRSR